MKKLSKEDLREMILSSIQSIPNNYRCYEITRLLRTEFGKTGIDLEVKDGLACYYPLDFFKAAVRKECQLLVSRSINTREAIETARLAVRIAKSQDLEGNIYRRIGVRHSWAILPKEKYLIDYHRVINLETSPNDSLLKQFPVLKGLEVRKFLKIVPLSRLPKNWAYDLREVIYMESAKQEGNTIHYPCINYFTKLRYAG